ncbi:MAG TPA: BREX-1 system phosphatase PglZ type B, partial [Syntrophobacteraceae bacterium]|nr:BREX-1 system phosphatase PglZ type B [Syntrophobacteraceae bacterium]
MPLNNEQTVLSRLVKAILNAAAYNPEVQAAPACILWPDKDRQWEAVISRLQKELPQLYVLGDYSPENRTGPAIWLRCVLAGTVSPEPEDQSESKVGDVPPKYSVPENIPIFYLPGVSRQDLRAIESCPEYLKPLAELQYRGTIWSQINAKDWTIFAFLKSDQGGLGLDVAQDSATRNAMQLSLYLLMDEDIDLLEGKHLDKDFFNTLLTGGDPVRDLLVWLDQGDTFRESRGENEWKAFVEVCKSQLAFDPENDGVLVGSSRLAERKGPWQPVWERFCEAPKRYPNIPLHIRKCKMPEVTLVSDVTTHGGWPQWNEEQETNLRRYLAVLKDLPAHEARIRIKELESKHSHRRQFVWSELGESPLASALFHLSILAEITSHPLTAGSCDELQATYLTS